MPFTQVPAIFGGMPEYIRKLRKKPDETRNRPPFGEMLPAIAGMVAGPVAAPVAQSAVRAASQTLPAIARKLVQRPEPMATPANNPDAELPTFQKPGMNWSEKLATLSGYLMDLDGGWGTGHADAARQRYKDRVTEAEKKFEEQRNRDLILRAAKGDMQALWELSPDAGLRQRQWNEEREYRTHRDAVDDKLRQAQEEREQREHDLRFSPVRFLGPDELKRMNLPPDAVAQIDALGNVRILREPESPRNIWQAAGNGSIFNSRTGEMRSSSVPSDYGGQATNPDAPFFIPTRANDINPFVQAQFGGDLVRQNPNSMLFNNGEIYQPTDNSGTVPGNMPPAVNSDVYVRYRSSSMAKVDGDVTKEARKNAIRVTTELMPQIATLKHLADQFPTGPLTDLRYEAGRWTGGRVGMSDEQLAARDAFISQTKSLALKLAETMKGSMSDSDRQWIETMAAHRNMPRESIHEILDTINRMAERQEFYAQGAEIWSNRYGGLSMPDENGKNFYQAWSDWSISNPITRKPKYEAEAVNPATGERMGLLNGQWVPIR